ncbi:TBC1 domain family member 15 [Acropora cervicornis]|uniref:TBC1 domain family member 15 n=1 Tax=Acropora cervicornis TaxID=6130 RepID=A0AAD9V939_ACRCE|nr:TBC1 domain family member 15 [Acropora cervicornis]
MAAAISQMDDDGVDKGKVVYCQDGVCVHTAVPTATQFANIISGKVTVVEKMLMQILLKGSEGQNMPSSLTQLSCILSNDLIQTWGGPMQSTHNHKLFVVTEDQSALKKSLDQLQLFSEDHPPSGAPWQRLFHSAYYDGMDALSKVTRYVRDVYEGLQPAGENAETQAQYSAAKREVDFEHLGDTASSSPVNGQSSLPEKRDLGEVPEVTRCEPLKLNEWTSFLDDCGRVKDVKGLHERVFRGGVDDLIRKPVWQYLLGYKKYGYTAQSQQFLLQAKEEEYRTMKLQWQSMTQTQEKNFAEFRERKQLIGYVQGMSDLLSPILVVMENEVEAFWCFVGFMEKLAHNFDENQEGMKAQLHQLTVLLKFIDPHFYSYLGRNVFTTAT